MSTRKTFIAVAKTVCSIAYKAEREKQANFQADIFAAENPRFKRDLFLAACGAK